MQLQGNRFVCSQNRFYMYCEILLICKLVNNNFFLDVMNTSTVYGLQNVCKILEDRVVVIEIFIRYMCLAIMAPVRQ